MQNAYATINLNHAAYATCSICGSEWGECEHSCIIDAKYLEPTYLTLMQEYLDDKFMEYHVTTLPSYDDGRPKRRKTKKRKGVQLIFKRVTSRMLREVVLPSLEDIAKRHKLKVKPSKYLPKSNALLRMVKVRVYR